MPYNETFDKLIPESKPTFKEEVPAVQDNKTFFIGGYSTEPGGNYPEGDFNEIFLALLNNDKALKLLADAIQKRTITAGKGLTGGGDLSTNRTIDVVSATDGIVVNENDIELNVYDGVDSTSTTRPGSARAVKTAYDKASEANDNANKKLDKGGYGGDAQDLKNEIDGKVSKSGDTMTGDLIIDKPSNSTQHILLRTAGQNRGEFFYNSNSKQIVVYNNTNRHSLRIGDDGKTYLYADNLDTNAKEVIAAINEVHKDKFSISGGEIDGDVYITGNRKLHTPWIELQGSDSNTPYIDFHGASDPNADYTSRLIDYGRGTGLEYHDIDSIYNFKFRDVVNKVSKSGDTIDGILRINATDNNNLHILRNNDLRGEFFTREDHIAILNVKAVKEIRMYNDGRLQLPAVDLATTSKEVVDSINEIYTNELVNADNLSWWDVGRYNLTKALSPNFKVIYVLLSEENSDNFSNILRIPYELRNRYFAPTSHDEFMSFRFVDDTTLQINGNTLSGVKQNIIRKIWQSNI